MKLLIIFFFLITPLLAFDPSLYNPEKKIGESYCLLSLDRINNVSWLTKKIAQLNKYISVNPDDEEAYIVREYFLQFLYEKVKGRVSKVKIMDIGIKYAAEGIKKFKTYPHRFWYASFIGEKYIFLGISILKKIPEVHKLLKDVADNAPRCCISAPLFMIGRYYYKLPPFPVSLGDIHLSEKYLRKAVKYNPHLIISYLYLAETLYGEGKVDEALNVLKLAKKVKPKKWMELYLWEKYRQGITILERNFKNGTWGKNKDIYIQIQLLNGER